MPTINYNAALPALGSLSGRSSIDINKWVSELKGNLSSLIKSLFSNSEVGFAYDPNDLSTLYRDAEGTIPVTAAGQPVGLMKDKSGRNNHAFQTVSAQRPLLQKDSVTGYYYLLPDAVDDFFITDSIDFTATDAMSLFSCSINTSSLPYQNILELGISPLTGTFLLRCPQVSKPFYLSGGTAKVQRESTAISSVLSGTVLSCVSKISTDTLRLRFNGFEDSLNTDQGTGNYGDYPLYIGARGGTSQQFKGRIYGLIGVCRLTTISEVAAIEKEFAKRVGVTLNV